MHENCLYPLCLILCSTWLPSQPTASQLSIEPVNKFPFDVAQDLYVVWLKLFSWSIVWLEQGHCCPERVQPGSSTSGTSDKRRLSSCVWKGVRMGRNVQNNHYIIRYPQKAKKLLLSNEQKGMTKGARAGNQETVSWWKQMDSVTNKYVKKSPRL